MESRRYLLGDLILPVVQYSSYNHTVCPRSSDPFYIVSYDMKWVTTSWTYSTIRPPTCSLMYQFTYIMPILWPFVTA